MDQDMAPPQRRRLRGYGTLLRRRRIFARLREGLGYDEIAAEEGVSRERVRQIVAEELRNRAVDSGAEHAKLQLDRLMPAMQLAAEAIAAGDVSAIAPYLKVIDRLDRYQSVAVANEKYDDEARRKLMEKINRMVANLSAGGARAAAPEPLNPIGAAAVESEAGAEGRANPAEPRPQEQGA